MTRAPRSTAGTDASAPPSLPKGVRAAATMTASVATVGLQHFVRAEQVPGDQDALHLTGPLTDLVDLDVTIEARHRRLLHEPHAAVDLHRLDRKSTRLNSSHLVISYAVFCLKK